MQFPPPSSNTSSSVHPATSSPAPSSEGATSAPGPVSRPQAAAAYYSAADLSKAREAFSLLVEISSVLLDPATHSKPSAPLLLYLTRLCEEGWNPHMLAQLVRAAYEEKENFLAERGLLERTKDGS